MSDDEEEKTKQNKSVVTANTKTKDADYRKTQQTCSKDEQVKRKEKDKEKDRKKDRKQDKKK